MDTQHFSTSADAELSADTSTDTIDAIDTIAAIATPPGVGGVGIVRVSGPLAFSIGRALFRAGALAAVYDHDEYPSHQLLYGHVVDPQSGEIVDEVLTTFMRAPHTYTRENVVELQAHGGPLVLRRILALTFATGARAAQPGEMTLRAFLNGRIDLAQAEAVMALIQAESDAGRRLALRQLQGELSAQVAAARDAVFGALTRIEASIDFPEEEVPPPDPAELADLIAQAQTTLAELLAGADRGRMLREGLRVAIVGRPNVGKSSLLNALLGVERAIVTPVAGTTRDTVEEAATLGGVRLHLVDTAGLTPTDDPVERLGVERSRAAATSADLLIFLLDGSVPLTDLDIQAATDLRALLAGETMDGQAFLERPVIVALNKADLPPRLPEADGQALWPSATLVRTSTLARAGIVALEAEIARLTLVGQAQAADALVSSARHQDALRRAQQQLAEATTTLARNIPLDFVAIDLRMALESLGEITGETATADLLDRIFADFCIGK